MTVSSLAGLSVALSLVGLVLFGYLSVGAYRRFREHPNERTTWMFLASTAMLIGLLALLTTALGAVLTQAGASSDVLSLMSHLAMMLRGALVAYAVALIYGQRRIRDEDREGSE